MSNLKQLKALAKSVGVPRLIRWNADPALLALASATGDDAVTDLLVGERNGKPAAIGHLDGRIVVASKSGLVALESESIEYSKITAVNVKKGLTNWSITITTSGIDIEVEKLQPVKRVQAFADAINSGRSTSAPPPAAAGGATDVATQLEKLAGLMDAGLLTADEFAAQKAKLLGM